MSDRGKPTEETLKQDLENMAYGKAGPNKTLSDDIDESKGNTLGSESDRSLANIHTGDRDVHDESQLTTKKDNDDQSRNPENTPQNITNTPEDSSIASLQNGGDLSQGTENAGTEEIASFREDAAISEAGVQQSEPLLGEINFEFQNRNLSETPGGNDDNSAHSKVLVEEEVNQPDNSENETSNDGAHSVSLDDNSIDEDASVGDVVGTVSAVDPESGSLSYSLSDDAGGMFTIDASTGEIKVAGALDYETTENYSVTVDVSDGTNVTQETFTLNVGDVDEAAHSVSLDDNAIDEDASIGDVVGTVSAVDPESGSLSYSFSDDAGGMFTIDASTGEIKVAGALDYETTENYSVTVDVSDGTNVTQETFTLYIGDVDEAAQPITLDDNAIDEDASIGDVVGTVSAVDPESGSLSYSFSDDAGGMFTIDASTGEIKVAGALDYEATENYSVTVDVSDGTNVTQETFTLNVGDVNEAPIISGDFVSGLGANRVINASFEDQGDGSNVNVDHGSWATYDGLPGWMVDRDGADAPIEIQFGGTGGISAQDGNAKMELESHSEGGYSQNSAHVYQDISTEPGENLTVSFWYSPRDSSSDNEVEVYWDGELLTTLSGSEQGWQQYTFEVGAGDGATTRLEFQGTSEDTTLGGYIDNVFVGGETLEFNTVSETADIGDLIGTITATDPEGDTLTYTLSDDADGKFSIDAETGEISVAAVLDFETAESHTIIVDVDDGSNVVQQSFTINVGDVDEAAHSVSLDDNAIDEDAAVGDVVGTVSAVDPESGSLSYSLSDDAGGMFTIDAATGEIKVAGALDHETTDSYSVTVDVSDGTNVTQETFTLNVGDVDEAAHSVSLDDNAINEDASIGDVVGTVSAVDPESGSLSYSLSDDAGGMFTIDASTGEIKVAGALDYETTENYSVTVDVSDGTNVTQETFTLNVGDLEAPSLSGRGNTIEHEEVGETADLSHMDAFPELNSGGNLEGRVGSEVFADMISDAETLVINHQSDATVTFQGEIAGYKNSIGAYQIDDDGNITSVQLLWGDASNGKLEAGVSTATYEGIEAGSSLGFFTISNGYSKLPSESVSGDGNTISETGSWMFVSPDFDPATDTPGDNLYNVNEDSGPPTLIFVEQDGTIHTQSGSVFHSLNQSEFNPESNVDDREHFVAGVDQDNGILNFGFEDVLGGGDNDFNDGMFSVELDARDLIDTPNPLFAEDENGQSAFQISDSDSGELSGLVVTLDDIQSGDTLSVGGAYDVVGNEVFLPDGSSTGISVSIVDDGSTITATLSGTGTVGNYEGIVQNLNFSNDSGADDISGYRNVSVVATDTSGETSDNLITVIEVSPDPTDVDAVALNGATIEGTGGNDVFFGSAGDDYATGDAGHDIFHFASSDGNDTFVGGDGGGWADTIVLSDGIPSGDVGDWLSLTSGSVESTADGEVFLSDDAAGTITLGDDAVLTFEGVEKIEA